MYRSNHKEVVSSLRSNQGVLEHKGHGTKTIIMNSNKQNMFSGLECLDYALSYEKLHYLVESLCNG